MKTMRWILGCVAALMLLTGCAGMFAMMGIEAPPAPEALTGNADTSTVTVHWKASAGAQEYQLYRSGTSGSTGERVYTGADVTFADTGLTAGTTYYYRVFAVNGVGKGPASSPLASATLPDVLPVTQTGSFSYTANLGSTPKTVYFVFCNPTNYSVAAMPSVSGPTGSTRSVPPLASVPASRPTVLKDRTPPAALPPLSRRSAKSIGAPAKPLLSDVAGTQHSFYDDSLTNLIPATCRLVTSASTASGATKTLNIWVADDCWTSGGTKAKLITQAMVDALADKFLKGPATDDDIYDWVTDIYGAEWGPNDVADLISPDDQITILLHDIENDNSTTGGVVGYFWAKDNYTTTAIDYSNARVMFNIDAVMYATDDNGTWTESDYWPQQVFSTLAHEFQHMIHFYQKQVLRVPSGADTDTWINEMASEVTEDFVATKLHNSGPRGVDWTDLTAGSAANPYGRFPDFNASNFISLRDWGGNQTMDAILASYATAYAYGAYLARNYGGPKLFRDMVQNGKTDATMIDDALAANGYTGVTFADTLGSWGAAGLLSASTHEAPGYQYNKGGAFSFTLGNETYDMGSVNLFNYTPQPTIFTSSPVGNTAPPSTSVLFYKAAQGLSGSVTWDVTLPAGMHLTVVIQG